LTNSYPDRIINGLKKRWVHARNNRRMRAIAAQVAQYTEISSQKPVIFFNASTRIDGVSLNAAFSQLAGWSLRLAGTPVIHFVCQSGMGHCVLGTDRDHPQNPPPCGTCMHQSRAIYSSSDVRYFDYRPDPSLECLVDGLDLQALRELEYQGMPLGRIVLPSLRWILRRHNLLDNDDTRFLYRQYTLSAWNVAERFKKLLQETRPQAAVLFNGMFYPEAAARWVAKTYYPEVRTYTHEVGLRPFSGFFTPGEATAYPIDIPEEFHLSSAQEERLNDYLQQRFKGNFSMAGIQFWPEMQRLSPEFWQKTAQFKQIVPVFTNVIFDTSQDHANVVFKDMFEWLARTKDIIQRHPETYFVIRAHPDESRPGKQSLESVADWVQQNRVDQMPNVLFVGPDEYLSSYELIQKSKFVMVYNSTIGLEATLMGAAVLCGGRARFTQIPTVFFPSSVEEYLQKSEELLQAENIQVPQEFRENAYRFLFYQVFRTSLPFDVFLEADGVWRGFVKLKSFSWQALLPEHSPTLRVIADGILRDQHFLAAE
jgi:hypothetical protein